MAENGPDQRKRRSTFRVVVIFLAVVAALAGLEFYALWSSNRAHTAPPAMPAAEPPQTSGK